MSTLNQVIYYQVSQTVWVVEMHVVVGTGQDVDLTVSCSGWFLPGNLVELIFVYHLMRGTIVQNVCVICLGVDE